MSRISTVAKTQVTMNIDRRSTMNGRTSVANQLRQSTHKFAHLRRNVGPRKGMSETDDRYMARQGQRWRIPILLLSILVVLTLHAYAWRDDISAGWDRIWNYRRPLVSVEPFFATIRDADRLVVRNGGFDCCASVKNDSILFIVTDPVELESIRQHIQFVPFTNALFGACMCCGYPGLDWYKGSKRLALTAAHHGQGIRWREFGTSYSGPFRHYGDVPLTLDSSIWLIEWLRQQGVTNDSDYSEQRLEKLRKIARKASEATSDTPLP